MSRLSVHEHHGMAMLIMKERGEIAANSPKHLLVVLLLR